MKSSEKAGGISSNHKLRIRSGVRAGGVSLNHNQRRRA
jgi:hypothetical protein